ncbi:hypothetical protein AJ80_05343 [Polytolypa hystricis UAMH7299]|uniref:Uncharacterized protein n=1 Tax=Polytolypa hystricis (strain UAMH7299) TaxID=1447883 RepID=A0A2B7Y432_POLH7|nr:hypothetical protein AJ80_05343 [Polytolypa hystricis UAMH7299]
MLNLSKLVPDRFMLDPEPSCWNTGWLREIKKWFELRGRVDVEKIKHHIEACRAYKKKVDDLNLASIEWQLTHLRTCRCNSDEKIVEGHCNCPPQPRLNTPKPVLGDCLTDGGEICLLYKLLENDLDWYSDDSYGLNAVADN